MHGTVTPKSPATPSNETASKNNANLYACFVVSVILVYKIHSYDLFSFTWCKFLSMTVLKCSNYEYNNITQIGKKKIKIISSSYLHTYRHIIHIYEKKSPPPFPHCMDFLQ